MKIATYQWPEHTRPCDFCLCLQDGCVYADFATDSAGHTYLVRISFDGYGCCHTDSGVSSMSADDTRTLSNAIADDDVDNDSTRDILRRYFDANKNRIWSDALVEHGLLPK